MTQLNSYEAGAVATLLREGPKNLFKERAGDGHYEAVENLKKMKWISEDKNKIHHLLEVDKAKEAAAFWEYPV